jgi:iron complex outermembrane receptor protein
MPRARTTARTSPFPFDGLLRPAAPRRAVLLATAAAALAALHGGASAQGAPASGQLQVITVTAERRVENIREVPSSVSALQGEILEVLNSGGQDIRQLAGRVPSLNIESSFGRVFPRFYIRGIGNTDFDLNASQPVGLVFDDVVQENPMLKGFPIFDLERIEVLRGPQGTLFGRNSPAGVIKFESAKPGKTFGGYGVLSIGRHSSVNAEGAVNVPLSETASMRFSLQSQNRDDWAKNTNAAAVTKEMEGYSDTAARVQLLVEPMRGLTVLGNVHHRKLDGAPRLFRANIIRPGTNDLVAGFDESRYAHDAPSSQKVESTGGSVRVRWEMGQMALTSVTGYESIETFSRTDVDGSAGPYGGPPFTPGVFIAFPAATGDGVPKHRQITQEFRLESTTKGPLSWLAGVYYFDEDLNIDSFSYAFPSSATEIFADQRQQNKAWAVFGTVNYDLSSALKLRGGLRYTKDEKDFVANRVQSPFGFIGRRTANTSADNTSGDVSLSYALDRDTNVYARVATGFRAPSIQGRLLFGDTLSVAKSEKVTSYEAGVKADLLDRRARLMANVFSYEVKDLQLTAVGGNANFNQLVNASKATGQGFEFDFQFLATEALLLTLGGSYNSTKIKDPGLRVDACGASCTVLDPITAPANPAVGKFSPTVSINGNPLPQAPKTTLTFTARYSFSLPGGEGYVMTDWAYRSKINFFLYEAVEFTGKALTEGGVRAGYVFGGGKYEAAAFVRNVTNQIRVVGAIDFNNLTGFINEPRTFGVSLRATF